VFGGVPIGRQRRALQNGVDILVATPGRLLDLVDQRILRLDHVEILVLDEADQMMDLGFIHALRRIAKLVPAERQTLFFSATMPKTIRDLASQFITDPVEVSVAPVAATADRVEQQVVHTTPALKPALLAQMLSGEQFSRVIVFTRTKHGADKVVRGLEANAIPAAAIHGNKSQAHRERALNGFRHGACRVLVATVIAARGIDVEEVSHVVNFDLPNVPEIYVHRIGRTARAGASGLAISFCTGEERPYLRSIERLTRQQIPVIQIEIDPSRTFNTPKPVARERDPRAGNGGRPQRPQAQSGQQGQARRSDRPRHWHGQRNGEQQSGHGQKAGFEGRRDQQRP
jgi:ATP-dependent RNA helicase RhlE